MLLLPAWLLLLLLLLLPNCCLPLRRLSASRLRLRLLWLTRQKAATEAARGLGRLLLPARLLWRRLLLLLLPCRLLRLLRLLRRLPRRMLLCLRLLLPDRLLL